MSLLTTSPMVGSWADQVDERLLNANAEQAALQQQAQQRLRQQQQLAAAQQQQQQQRAHASSQADVPAPNEPTAPAAPARPFGPYHIDPQAPMRPEFAATWQAQRDANGGPAGGWGAAGKLQSMARDVFQRAYGLNGVPQEEHEPLCEEVMRETGCSRKSFCELIYAHSYASELTDLRAMVPDYPQKVKRVRDASERGKKKAAAKKEEETRAVQQQQQQPQQQQQHEHLSTNLAQFLSRGSLSPHHSNVTATVDPFPLQLQPAQFINGQPVHQNPTIHLSHRLVPSTTTAHSGTTVLSPKSSPSSQVASPALQPHGSARFAPPPAASSARRVSGTGSPLMRPMGSLTPTASGMPMGVRRSIDATNALAAAVAAANSVSPHLAPLGTDNPPLPMVPSSPNLTPTTGAALKSAVSAAKAVGSPLRQGISVSTSGIFNKSTAAPGTGLPPRASPMLHPARLSGAVPPGFRSPSHSAHASPMHLPMRSPPSATSTSSHAHHSNVASPLVTPTSTVTSPDSILTLHSPTSAPKATTPHEPLAAIQEAKESPAKASPPPPAQVRSVLDPAKREPKTSVETDSTGSGNASPVEGEDEDDAEPEMNPQLTAGQKKKAKKARAKVRKAAEEAAAAVAIAAEVTSPSLGKKSSSSSTKKHTTKFAASPPTSPVHRSFAGGATSPAARTAAANDKANGTASRAPASLTTVVLLAIVGSALFLVTRSVFHSALFEQHAATANESTVVTWSVLAAVYAMSIFFALGLFRTAHEAHHTWSGVVLELSTQLDQYVSSWELLAVDDPAQLMAAIEQIQTLLDAALASFTGLSSAPDMSHALEAIEHAVQTLDFLHLAHQNLVAELGSTQPIMRLVNSLDIVRSKVMLIRSKLNVTPQGRALDKSKQPKGAAATSASTDSSVAPMTILLAGILLVNVALLLFSPPLASAVLNLLPLVLVLVLSVVLAVVWSAQYPFSPAPDSVAAGVQAFPARLLDTFGAFFAAHVSLEPLHYLRSRLLEKAAETQARIDDQPVNDDADATLDA